MRDLDIKSTSRSDSYDMRLQNQIRSVYAKFRHHRSIQSSLARQTSAYSENEKNFRLHS